MGEIPGKDYLLSVIILKLRVSRICRWTQRGSPLCPNLAVLELAPTTAKAGEVKNLRAVASVAMIQGARLSGAVMPISSSWMMLMMNGSGAPSGEPGKADSAEGPSAGFRARNADTCPFDLSSYIV